MPQEYFQTIVGGYDSNHTYIIGCPETHALAIVDAACDWSALQEALLDAYDVGYHHPTYVLLTHVHFDHIACLSDIIRSFPNIQIVAHESCVPSLLSQKNIKPHVFVAEGDTIQLGGDSIQIIHTPGHQPECICYIWRGRIFTGDTIFVEACGRTDLAGSDPQQQFDSLRRFAVELDPSLTVHAGHDYGSMPHSTIAYERENNPYLRVYKLSPKIQYEEWYRQRMAKTKPRGL